MEIIRYVSKYYIERFLARDIDIYELLKDSSYYNLEPTLIDKGKKIMEIKIIIPDIINESKDK